MRYINIQGEQPQYIDNITAEEFTLSGLDSSVWLAADEYEARVWRNKELANLDLRSLLTDDPDHEAVLNYRQALRNWPSTDDFPDIRPTL